MFPNLRDWAGADRSPLDQVVCGCCFQTPIACVLDPETGLEGLETGFRNWFSSKKSHVLKKIGLFSEAWNERGCVVRHTVGGWGEISKVVLSVDRFVVMVGDRRVKVGS
ncbi:hypothetical protein TNCV_776791 [Trichonephila clavipes]|nr:hypothetical protein TNCV_776791 [Trichonephila clavipes]